MVELTHGFIRLIETGKNRASLETLLSLCHAFNITLHDFLVGNQINQTSNYNTEYSELDVYQQLHVNWEHFINDAWNESKKLKRRKNSI